jgi:hypothetical protein
VCHIVHCGVSGAQKRVGKPYVEFVVLHSVVSDGDVVHSGASGVRNIDALFFLLGRDRYGFQKKRVNTRDAKFVF